MNNAKVAQADKRGQIVIPQSIRKKLNLEDGAAFWVHEVEGGIYLQKIARPKGVPKKIK